MFVGTSRTSLGLTVAPMTMKSQPSPKNSTAQIKTAGFLEIRGKGRPRCRVICPAARLGSRLHHSRKASPSHLHLSPMTCGEMKAVRALLSKDSSDGSFHHVKALLAGDYGRNDVASAESERPKSPYWLTLGKQLFDFFISSGGGSSLTEADRKAPATRGWQRPDAVQSSESTGARVFLTRSWNSSPTGGRRNSTKTRGSHRRRRDSRPFR